MNINSQFISMTKKQLQTYARESGIHGHSKYTRVNNLRRFVTDSTRRRALPTTTISRTISRTISTTTKIEVPKAKFKFTMKRAPVQEELPEEDNDGGETLCAVDGRLTACAENDKREATLHKLLKGDAVSDEALTKSFACKPSQLREVVLALTQKYPTLPTTIQHIGGQSKNYDYTFNENIHIELKTNKASTSKAVLEKVPWSGYGQLIQLFLNVKDLQYKPLLESFDTAGMIRSWFDTIIVPVVCVKYNITDPITFESYYTLLFKTAAKAAKHYGDNSLSLGARALFQYFHTHRTKAENDYRAKLWKTFCKSWMETHKFTDTSVYTLLQNTLQKKHIWICTTNSGAYTIEGPICTGATFKEVKAGKDASVLVYTATLKKPSSPESYSVDVKFRFYWKNGGQGVHNLCLQVS